MRDSRRPTLFTYLVCGICTRAWCRGLGFQSTGHAYKGCGSETVDGQENIRKWSSTDPPSEVHLLAVPSSGQTAPDDASICLAS